MVSPRHIVVSGPALIAGGDSTCIVWLALSVHPYPSVITRVAVYVPPTVYLYEVSPEVPVPEKIPELTPFPKFQYPLTIVVLSSMVLESVKVSRKGKQPNVSVNVKIATGGLETCTFRVIESPHRN